MFAAKKIIAAFLLPPGIFVLLLVLAGLWSLKRKKGLSALFLFSLAGLIWLSATSPAANYIMGRLETGAPPAPAPKADVIIMLGGGIHSDATDLSGTGAPAHGTMERMVTAARLHKITGAPILISGGGVFPTTPAVAPVTARFLKDLGIPPEAILIETNSRDTYENALYCKQICHHNGFTKPIVVTSGYHVKRAVFAFKTVGLDIEPYPCGLTANLQQTYHWRELLPDASHLMTTSAGLHEIIGLMYYRLRYKGWSFFSQ